ncbi:hypothetical protein K440DRAFT_643021 [Wilcoxina mikolae CBS 423.85]|nr:hypothetical protein K440DRAFT_643021 [Wilcoxina mikolae CBS 423.85]
MQAPEEDAQSVASIWPSARLPLASLTPDTVTASSPAFVEGVVQLLWPFSPSSATLSLLVCEEDFRLRNSKGQLRVDFRGASARAVDSKEVQIGDRVQLSLEGAQLEALEKATERDVPWTVVFTTRLAMKFKNTGDWVNIDVDAPEELSTSFASTIPDDDHIYAPASPPIRAPATPPPRSETTGNVWDTSGVFKRKGDLLANSPLHLQRLFGEEEEDEYNINADLNRPRKRPRFSSSYRLVDRTPSPELEGGSQETADPFVDHAPPTANVEAVRLAAMPHDEPLTIYRDAPSPEEPSSSRPTHIEMPPPPLPAISTQQSHEQDGEMPDSPSLRPVPSPKLPLVSPFLHRGLSGVDYMSIDTEERGKGLADLEMTLDADVAIEVESPTPVKESDNPLDRTEDGPSPGASLVVEDSRPATSDGESEKDSLFDELSDKEDARARPRSRSPLPGPSPLRRVERAKTPERSPTAQRTKLSLQISATPSQQRDTPRSAAPKTPHLYLPTPSPKITSAEHGGGFPFAALPRLDFGAKPSEKTEETLRGQKRKFARQSLDSSPADLSTYFGRPKPAGEHETPTKKDNTTDAPITPDAEEVQDATLSQRKKSPIQFKSGITTPLSDFPPLAFLSWGTTVDVIGAVCQYSPVARAESGQRDYYTAVRIVDSSQPSGIIMRLFRPYKIALPEVEVGDVVMLRSFKHKFMGVSTENSAWAVWKNHGKGPAVCAGPPVEYGDGEEQYVAAIGAWYENLDPKLRQEMEGKPGEELVAGVKK